MKKHLFSLALAALSVIAFAADPNLSSKAKAINLNEVVESIKYPNMSNQMGIEGTVLMYVEIDAQGNVANSTALAYPCSSIKKSVEVALENLKFEPAKNIAGEAVASSLRIPFEFELSVD